MGYFTKYIAKESATPAIVSLSENPNYIQFESRNNPKDNQHLKITWQVISTSIDASKAKISIIDSASEKEHNFEGTYKEENVNNNTFLIVKAESNDSEDIKKEKRAITAENIKACLLSDDFFKSNFNITIPPINKNGEIINGDTLHIYSTGTGKNVTFSYAKILDSEFINANGNTINTTNNDTIDSGKGNTEIEIEVYKDTGIFLGVDDKPKSNAQLGTLLASLSKSYYNAPVWFDLNSLIGGSKTISSGFLDAEGWTETGTIADYRFIARKNDGINRIPFYISNVLYTLKGYDRNLEVNDLSAYVYDTRQKNVVKPLSRQPALFHTQGQTHYFNFLLSDPDRNKSLGSKEYNLGILCKLYTPSKKLLTTVISYEQNRKKFNVANTIRLDLDTITGNFKNTGFVEVYLCRDRKEVSEPLLFRILPEGLYKVNDFVFLNSLGGWSTFNFSGTETTNFKASKNTIFKTQTPGYTASSEIESVYNKEVEEQFIVQSMPISKTICDWLKELSSSVAVYELATKRYIVVDELNIKPNSKDDLFRVEMKYHYSDRYNALIV